MRLHGNARQHIAVLFKTYLESPSYSAKMSPSNYHVQCLTAYGATKNWVDAWIASEEDEFFDKTD